MTPVRPTLWLGLAGSAVVLGLTVAVVAWRRQARRMAVQMRDLSPAFSSFTPRTKPVRGIVIHHTVTGNPKATQRVLENKKIGTHFEVAQDGQVIRYMDPAKYVVEASNWANSQAIAIDLTHLSHAPWPEVQVAATAQLVAQLVDEFGLAPGVAPDGVRYANWGQVPAGVGILRHRNVHPTECPQDFPMQRLGPVVPKL